MIGETNINGGAGLNGKGALLKIKALTGSTITVSKESYSKTIKVSQLDPDNNNWSYWIFQTTNFGEWAVTATIGANTDSKTIVISDNKQYDLSLFTMLYLYNEGNENTAVTGGWEAKSRDGYFGTLTKNADNMVITGQSQTYSGFTGIANDITNLQSHYTTAYIETGSVTTDNNGLDFLDNWSTQAQISTVKLSTNSIRSLPIPSGSSVIAVRAYMGSVTIKKVWME